MASVKRKALESQLQRRVRARRDFSAELEDVNDSQSSLPEPDDDIERSQSESEAEGSEKSSVVCTTLSNSIPTGVLTILLSEQRGRILLAIGIRARSFDIFRGPRKSPG